MSGGADGVSVGTCATRVRPRLLCLVQLPPPIHGVTVVNQTVATSELLASRFDLEILPLASAASFEDLDRVSLRKLGRLVQTSIRLAHALLVRRPDAVYFTISPSGAAFYRDCVFIAIMKAAGVRRVFHLHGTAIRSRLGTRWRRQVYRWAFREAWVIHLSERLIADVADLVPREHVAVVANGVAERRVHEPTQREGVARVLFLSNMTETKGPLVLIDALGRLRARGIAFEATFAGAAHHREFLARCHVAIRRHGVERQVRYVGPAYGAAKHRLLEQHDIFVLPTCRDAFPLVALEAMQAGLPVVATNEGALPEIVENGETGLLVPSRDPEALACCIARLVTDPELRRRLGAAGRARCMQTYTQTAFEHNLAAALTTCTQASSSRPRAPGSGSTANDGGGTL